VPYFVLALIMGMWISCNHAGVFCEHHVSWDRCELPSGVQTRHKRREGHFEAYNDFDFAFYLLLPVEYQVTDLVFVQPPLLPPLYLLSTFPSRALFCRGSLQSRGLRLRSYDKTGLSLDLGLILLVLVLTFSSCFRHWFFGDPSSSTVILQLPM